MSEQLAIPIAEASQVSDARRQAAAMTVRLGFSPERTGTVSLVVTEAATNLIKHAQSGVVMLRPLRVGPTSGIEVMALDGGDGMSNVALSMRDGHSTAGSAGIGLGALSRLSAEFDVYSRPGAGTVVRCVVWSGEPPAAAGDLQLGVVCVPMKGESVAGDGWDLHFDRGRYLLVVVDGLGHGPEAAAAADAAKIELRKNPKRTPAEHMTAMHGALRATRGAAGAVVEIRPAEQVGTFAGIGNIGCFVRSGGKTRSLASHNGILGHQMYKVQEFSFPFPYNALLFAYSDGMTSRWNPGSYPGLEARHPGVIAAALYRDHSRGRDDTTIAVARNMARGLST